MPASKSALDVCVERFLEHHDMKPVLDTITQIERALEGPARTFNRTMATLADFGNELLRELAKPKPERVVEAASPPPPRHQNFHMLMRESLGCEMREP